MQRVPHYLIKRFDCDVRPRIPRVLAQNQRVVQKQLILADVDESGRQLVGDSVLWRE